jgi:glutaredoxin-related protein
MKEFLSENNIKFDFIDITDSLRGLRIFLRYWGNKPEFEAFRESGDAAIPFIMVNDGEKFFFEKPINNIDELRD